MDEISTDVAGERSHRPGESERCRSSEKKRGTESAAVFSNGVGGTELTTQVACLTMSRAKHGRYQRLDRP
jgi:hypothetical protein